MNKEKSQTQEWVEYNSYAKHNHIVKQFISLDQSVFTVDMTEDAKNRYGYAHGGIFYSMADAATGELAHMDGRSYVTQSGTLSFLSNQKEGRLTATATVCHRGRTITLIDVKITGENDRLLAMGTFTLFCTGAAVSK